MSHLNEIQKELEDELSLSVKESLESEKPDYLYGVRNGLQYAIDLIEEYKKEVEA